MSEDLKARRFSRYHLIDECPLIVDTTAGRKRLGKGWLVISEDEYAALSSEQRR